ncbi:MAG: class I SAM-dependent methyltransferase [Carboxydocellales bacterium]
MKDVNPNIKNITNLLNRRLKTKHDINISGKEENDVFNSLELLNAINECNNNWYYDLHRSVTSHRKFIGKAIVFFKKALRKTLKWYIRPLFEDQMRFNNSVTQALNLMVKNLENINKEIARINKNETLSGFDYVAFEDKYRGERSDIKDRQRVYLPYFINSENVLDIGCGRGEFVELLMENKISVLGLDTDEEMIAKSHCLGLPVKYADAIDYLKNIPDNTLGGVFLSHVIEHLKPQVLVDLISLAHKKLKTGCYFIAESPNSLNLGIFSSPFYLDLTHNKPVHPETLKFLLRNKGFEIHDTLFLSPIPKEAKLQLINSDLKDSSIINQNLERLNDLLFGYQDYSVIGRKISTY